MRHGGVAALACFALAALSTIIAVVAWRMSIRIDKHEKEQPAALLGVVSPSQNVVESFRRPQP